MTTETMNIHKALSEKKILDSRIEKEIISTSFVGSHVVNNDRVSGINIKDFINNAKSKMDKIRDMIARRDAIHRGVQQSNAVTKVKIGGSEYTVAEAIWMNEYGTTLLSKLKDTISQQYNKELRKVDSANTQLEQDADNFVKSVYDSNKDSKRDPDTIAKIRSDYIESRRYEIVDPINAAKTIDELEDRIQNFLSEVNTALSTSNAITEITIEY